MHIGFTLSTVPLTLLSIYLWHRAKGRLLPVVMFMSVFQAASIIDLQIGGALMGLGPSYLLLLLALWQKLIARPAKGTSAAKPLKSTSILLGTFALYSTLSAFINPWIFEGVLFTNTKFGEQVPLKWNAGLLPQLCYLLLALLLYYVAGYRTTPSELAESLHWYVGGSALAALIAVYQFVCLKTGLPFPSQFLHTNPVYVIYEAYEISGFARVNSTFTEASAAAFSFMTALSLVLWRVLMGAASLKNLMLCALMLLGLLLTISTSGYICLFYILFIAGLTYLTRWRGSSRVRTVKILLAIPVAIFLLLVLSSPSLRGYVNNLLNVVVFTKGESSSYAERSKWSADAINTAIDTFFFGAGWGVCRASGIFQTLLGNVGIPGILCFFGAIGQVFVPVFKKIPLNSVLQGSVLFSLSAVIFANLMAGTDVTPPIIWVLLATAARLATLKPRPNFPSLGPLPATTFTLSAYKGVDQYC